MALLGKAIIFNALVEFVSFVTLVKDKASYKLMYKGEENESLAEIAQGLPINSQNHINTVAMRAEGQEGRRNMQQRTGEGGTKRNKRGKGTETSKDRQTVKQIWEFKQVSIVQMTNQDDTLIKVS